MHNLGRVFNVPDWLIQQNSSLFDKLINKPCIYFRCNTIQNEILLSALPDADLYNMFGVLIFTRKRIGGTKGIQISDITASCERRKQFISFYVYIVDGLELGSSTSFSVVEADIRDYRGYPSMQKNVEAIMKKIQQDNFQPLNVWLGNEIPINNIFLDEMQVQKFIKNVRFVQTSRDFEPY